MFFENGGVLSKFEKLLEHRCSKCKNRPPDKNFKALQDHLRKDHSLYYCDLCVEHLKVNYHVFLNKFFLEMCTIVFQHNVIAYCCFLDVIETL